MAADERWANSHAGLTTYWPDFADTWMGSTLYPTGRGQERPQRGWTCSGCGRGYSPLVLECTRCPEVKAVAAPEAGAGCRCCPEDS